eukprot:SM000006S19416  [mRNA]  locus=s6:663579:666344:+ [translate_table: standard]
MAGPRVAALAELVHARFAMAGVAGIFATDLLRITGLSDLPVWYEAGATHFNGVSTESLFVIQLILFAFVECKRWMDFVTPHSQASEDAFFFGIEPALGGLSNGYPGGPLFNPLGLASDPTKPQPQRWKELKNGRLAMLAFLGCAIQAYATGAGPLDNLLLHLSDPWHHTIGRSALTVFGVKEQLEAKSRANFCSCCHMSWVGNDMQVRREKRVPCTKEGAGKDVSPVVPVVVDTADSNGKGTQERQEHKHGLVDKAFAAVQVELAGQVQRQKAEPRECPCAQGSKAEELRDAEPQLVPALQVSRFQSGRSRRRRGDTAEDV